MSSEQAAGVLDAGDKDADPIPVSVSRQWLILLLVQVSTLAFGVAVTATNVVVPQIRGALSLTQEEGAWISRCFSLRRPSPHR